MLGLSYAYVLLLHALSEVKLNCPPWLPCISKASWMGLWSAISILFLRSGANIPGSPMEYISGISRSPTGLNAHFVSFITFAVSRPLSISPLYKKAISKLATGENLFLLKDYSMTKLRFFFFLYANAESKLKSTIFPNIFWFSQRFSLFCLKYFRGSKYFQQEFDVIYDKLLRFLIVTLAIMTQF